MVLAQEKAYWPESPRISGQDRNQVDTVTAAVRERGGRVHYEDRHPHAGGSDHYALFFEDPDRIKVELVAP